MVNLTYWQGREDHSDPCESPRDSCRSDCRRWTGDRKVPLPAPTPKTQVLILSSLTANRKCVLCLHHPRPWDRRQPRSKPRLRMEGSCRNPRALSREPPGPLPPPRGSLKWSARFLQEGKAEISPTEREQRAIFKQRRR